MSPAAAPVFDHRPRLCAGCATPSPVPGTLAQGWTQWSRKPREDRPAVWCPTCASDGTLHTAQVESAKAAMYAERRQIEREQPGIVIREDGSIRVRPTFKEHRA